jgi:hypothetical protein
MEWSDRSDDEHARVLRFGEQRGKGDGRKVGPGDVDSVGSGEILAKGSRRKVSMSHPPEVRGTGMHSLFYAI